MKRITAIALFTIASFFIADRRLAQSDAVQATVPFDFTVGSKLLPPATFTITSVSNNVIEIQDREKHVSILALRHPDSKKSEQGGKLVFDKYGEQYFLREILCDQPAR